MSIVTYFIVGALSFSANYAVFYMVVNALKTHYVVGNLAGFVVGTGVNYLLSAQFVFKGVRFERRSVEGVLTLLVSSAGVVVETLLIGLLHSGLELDLSISKIGAAGVVFFWNYGARRFFIFGAVKQVNRSNF